MISPERRPAPAKMRRRLSLLIPLAAALGLASSLVASAAPRGKAHLATGIVDLEAKDASTKLTATSQPVFVERIEDIPYVLGHAPETVPVLWMGSSSPSQTRKALEEKPSYFTLLSALPTTQTEFQATYGTRDLFDEDRVVRPTKKAVEALLGTCMKRQEDLLLYRAISRVGDLKGGKTMADALRGAIAGQKANELSVIAGHVDSKGNLRLPDGSFVPIAELKGAGKTWVVACDTAKHLSPTAAEILTIGKPRIGETAAAAAAMKEAIVNKDGSLSSAMAKAQRAFKFIVPIAGVLLFVESEEEKD